MGSENEMGSAILQVRQMLPQQLQVLLFSATWPDRVCNFAEKLVPDANRIRVMTEDLTLETITQTYIKVGNNPHDKLRMISDLYGALNVGQSIIFVNSRSSAFALAQDMR